MRTTIEFDITITNPGGLHFRTAEAIMRAAESNGVSVRVFNPSKGPDHPGACTFLGLTVLALGYNTVARVRIEGGTMDSQLECQKAISGILTPNT